MKKTTPRKSAFSLSRLLACLLCLLSLILALLAISGSFGTKSLAQAPGNTNGSSVWVGASYHNDISPPLREMPASSEADLRRGVDREANENPKIPYRHVDSFDPVVQNGICLWLRRWRPEHTASHPHIRRHSFSRRGLQLRAA